MGFLWDEFFYRPLLNGLVFLYTVIPFAKEGLAIIVFTIIIRMLLFPLTLKSIEQQQAMRQFQPEVEKLKKKYKNKPEKLNQELLGLYSKHGINPAMSCLPILIQLPIMIALYQAFRGFTPDHIAQVNEKLYAFIPPLTDIDPHFLIWNLSQPDPTFILAVLAGVLQFFQTRLMLPKNTSDDPTQKAMQQTAYFLPLLLIITSTQFPAALPLYWTVGAAVAILQTRITKALKRDTPK